MKRCLAVLAGILLSSSAFAQQTPDLRSRMSEASIEASLQKTALLHTIYQANRADTKESVRLLDDAYRQSQTATADDVNAAPEPLRRTALHWAVLGSLQAKQGDQLDAYLRLVEALIAAGADVNAADFTGVTPLDMQDFANNDDMGDLLVEYGAHHRVDANLAKEVMPLLEQITTLTQQQNLRQLRQIVHSDLPLGAEIAVRLLQPVSSKRSRPGDIVQAVTLAPVFDASRVTLPTGSLLEGVVTSAVPAGNQYERARLGIIFVHVVHDNGQLSPLRVRWIGVDNARETMEPNVAIGLAFPRSKLDKIGWGTRVAGIANPGLGYAVEAATWGYTREMKREIDFDEGVDLTLQVILPSTMKQVSAMAPPPGFAAMAKLTQFANALPKRNTNLDGKDADVTNILFVGTEQEVTEAFLSGGWIAASDLTTGSALKTFAATALERGYSEAPLSQLYLQSSLPAMEFEKQNDTFAKRHHLRIYRWGQTFEGHPVWIAAATHDTGIRAVDKGAKWTHAVDPHIDRERNKIGIDLIYGGKVKGIAFIDRPELPRGNDSIAGHMLLTDGRMLVLGLGSAAPLLQPRHTWDASCMVLPDPQLPEARDKSGAQEQQ